MVRRKSCVECGRDENVSLKDGVCGFCRELDRSCEAARQAERYDDDEDRAAAIERCEHLSE